jgi:hypothetical protein
MYDIAPMFAESIDLLSSPDQHVCVYLDGEIYIDPVTPPGLCGAPPFACD